jgi:hypothetical protein
MSGKPEFTQTQLDNWKKYEAARYPGVVHSRQRQIESGLSVDDYWFCHENYIDLRKAVLDAQQREIIAKAGDEP